MPVTSIFSQSDKKKATRMCGFGVVSINFRDVLYTFLVQKREQRLRL